MGAVVAHPHPLLGGDMGNAIVAEMTKALFGCGISTLRFNFRGVGESTGIFDDGRGEQDDIRAALSFMEEQGIREILPAGYSFGAWVTAAILKRARLLPALFVSPPLALFPFDVESMRGRTGLIVCGGLDPYCPVEVVKNFAARLTCGVEIIPGADHFFQAREDQLAACITDFARRVLKPQM